MGLKTLRSAIAVIPQDPVLFQGSIRFNIDPFNLAKDTEVWKALEEANLKDKVRRQSVQHIYGVFTQGGQRQGGAGSGHGCGGRW